MECTENFFFFKQCTHTLNRPNRPCSGPAPAVTLGLAGGSQSQDADSWRLAAAGSGRTDGEGRGPGQQRPGLRRPLRQGPPGARSNPGDSREGASACTPGRRPAPAPTTRKDPGAVAGSGGTQAGRTAKGRSPAAKHRLEVGREAGFTPSRTPGRTHRTAGQIGPGSGCQGVTRKQKRPHQPRGLQRKPAECVGACAQASASEPSAPAQTVDGDGFLKLF